MNDDAEVRQACREADEQAIRHTPVESRDRSRQGHGRHLRHNARWTDAADRVYDCPVTGTLSPSSQL
jgi:hypothetical protein